MKFAAAAVLSLLACATLPAAAQDAAKPAAATLSTADSAAAGQAASSFLALLDTGKFADSWTGGAAMLRGAVPQDQWNGVLGSMRKPLGELKSRKQLASTFTRSLPGAPAGEYVVVQYQSEFANKTVTETVTPMREADGSWKVAGYFVQ